VWSRVLNVSRGAHLAPPDGLNMEAIMKSMRTVLLACLMALFAAACGGGGGGSSPAAGSSDCVLNKARLGDCTLG